MAFAANFIRWTSQWLADQAQPAENALNVRKLGIKRQGQVAAHVSAQVIQSSEGKLLKFSEPSTFAGQVLKIAGSEVLLSLMGDNIVGQVGPRDRKGAKRNNSAALLGLILLWNVAS